MKPLTKLKRRLLKIEDQKLRDEINYLIELALYEQFKELKELLTETDVMIK